VIDFDCLSLKLIVCFEDSDTLAVKASSYL